MTQTSTYRAVAALERQCIARLVRIHLQLGELHSRRRELLERQAAVRGVMLASARWDSLACQVLAGYTAWGAAAVSVMAAVRRDLFTAAEHLAAERRRWAWLRVGLQRRDARALEPARANRGTSWLA